MHFCFENNKYSDSVNILWKRRISDFFWKDILVKIQFKVKYQDHLLQKRSHVFCCLISLIISGITQETQR